MVQVLPGIESFGAGLGRSIGQGLGQGLEGGLAKRQKSKELAGMNEFIKKEFGYDLREVPEEFRQTVAEKLLEDKFSKEQMALKSKYSMEEQGLKSQAKSAMINDILGTGGQSQSSPTGQKSDEGDISDEAILKLTMVDPNLAKALQHQKEFKEKQREKSPEFQRQQKLTQSQADADIKYNTQLQETSKQHELKKQSLSRLEALNKKGVTGKPFEKLLEKSGLVALTSEGRREFAADVKNLITDIRSILGAQFTGFEFQTILNAYPSADFSKEANASIIKNLNEFQNIKEKEVEFANQLKKENGGKIPEDFQSKVNDMVRAYANTRVDKIKENTQKVMNDEYGIPEGSVLMFDNQGEPLSVPESDVSMLLDEGIANLP